MNARTELLMVGIVTARGEQPRAWWQRLFRVPAEVTLWVRSEDERCATPFKLPSTNCLAAKVGSYVRVKRTDPMEVYKKPTLHAFTAPAPKPRRVSRGYLLRILCNGIARIRLDDDSVVEVPRAQMRGNLFEGCAVKGMEYVHGWCEHLRERYFEVDGTRPAWTGLAREAVLVNSNFGQGIERFDDVVIGAAM